MKGLLLKDFYLLTKYCRAYLLMALFFLFTSFFSIKLFFVFFPCLYISMIPLTLYAYDEREKWTVYSQTLPYDRKQLVSAKYIIGLILSGFIIIIVSAVQVIKITATSAFSAGEFMTFVAVLLPISLLPSSFMMPFVFKYGSEKGRMIYYIPIGIFCFFTSLSISLIKDINILSAKTTPVVLILIILVSVAIYALSWLLSIAFYKKREI